MHTLTLNVLDDNILIADDTSVVKIFKTSGISLYESKSDAIRGSNPAKVFSPTESLEFLEKTVTGLNGSAVAINKLNSLQVQWKNYNH